MTIIAKLIDLVNASGTIYLADTSRVLYWCEKDVNKNLPCFYNLFSTGRFGTADRIYVDPEQTVTYNHDGSTVVIDIKGVKHHLYFMKLRVIGLEDIERAMQKREDRLIRKSSNVQSTQ